MLVLTRLDGQSFTIGPDITITVMYAKNGKARIGINAPKELQIVRDNAKKTEPEEGCSAGRTPHLLP